MQIAEGLAHRAVAMLQADPTYSKTVVDPDCPFPDAYCEIKFVSSDAAVLSVFLYQGSTEPAYLTSVDPIELNKTATQSSPVKPLSPIKPSSR